MGQSFSTLDLDKTLDLSNTSTPPETQFPALHIDFLTFDSSSEGSFQMYDVAESSLARATATTHSSLSYQASPGIKFFWIATFVHNGLFIGLDTLTGTVSNEAAVASSHRLSGSGEGAQPGMSVLFYLALIRPICF